MIMKKTIDPVTAVRPLGIATILATGLLMSHIGAAVGASSCVPPAGKSTITSCFLDLTGSPSSTRAPQSAVLNGGIFRVPAQNEAVAQGAFDGTGVLQPFVRIQERSNGSTLGLNGIES